MEAVKGEETVAQLAAGYEVHPRATIWEADFPIVPQSDENFRALAAEIRQNL